MNELPAKFWVVATSLVTLVAAVVAGLTVFATEMEGLFPDAGWVRILSAAVVALGVVVAAIRRLMPAPPETHGLLPPKT